MLTAILFFTIRRYSKAHPGFLKAQLTKILVFVAVLLLCLSAACVQGQMRRAAYKISINGKPVGTLNLFQNIFPDSFVILIRTTISTRRIFQFNVVTEDKTVVRNGSIQYSSTFRQVNNGSRRTTLTRKTGNNYTSEKEGRQKQLNRAAIHHNMSSLYMTEPVDFREVYSDAYQEFLAIDRVKPHCYKIELPDGNYNEYSYENGICHRVSVHQTFFTATIDLNELTQ